MNIVIAAGGTGGHVFPGLAVATALRIGHPEVHITFVGTAAGIETKLVPGSGHELKLIRIAGLKGKSLKHQLSNLFRLPYAFLQSWQLLLQLKPKAVLGIGGYASGPVLIAAWAMRIPTAILEPNSIPGFTNKVLGKFVRKVFGAFEQTAAYFSRKKFVLIGNPLRQAFSVGAKYSIEDTKTSHLLVMGGSLGARPLNECVPQALAELKKEGLDITCIHQTGTNEVAGVQSAYDRFQIRAHVVPFIDDPAQSLSQAKLVICRAGAMTCSEVAAIGVPAIFVPFPLAIYDHQTYNAKALSDHHAGMLLPQSQMTPERLAQEIQSIWTDDSLRARLSQNALALGKYHAAEHLAESMLSGYSKA